MPENISTSVKDVTFDSIISEFEKPVEKTDPPDLMKNIDKSNPILDAPIKKEEPVAVDPPTADPPKKDADVLDPKKKDVPIKDIDSVLDRVDDDDDDDKNKDAVQPASFVSVLEELTKEEVLFPFDEDKPLSNYSNEDLKELLKANIEHHKKEALNTEINEFFESLPQEIQYAAKYVADGGTDLKGLFKALAATEEIRSLDTKQLKDRESIIREYYRAIDWGSEDEISEEVDRIKELGDSEVEKLANKYKPKLEKMHEEVIKQQLTRQERTRAIQEQEMQTYLENAQEAIVSGKLGDLQLDKKTQSALWAGLTQASYQTRRGATTNELGHLLEKYQYIEPNFELMYEALWLLRDPKGFKEAVAKNLKNAVVSETVRVLKTEQGKKSATSSTPDPVVDTERKRKSIPKPQPNFLSGLKK